MSRCLLTLFAFGALLVIGCGSEEGDLPQPGGTPATAVTMQPTVSVPITPSPTLPPQGGGSRTAEATPADIPDIRATRLRIPSLGIDAEVQASREIPDSGVVPAGCPAEPPGTTVTVPEQGIATPVEEFEGLEGRAWIYGHSRWLGEPGLFFALPALEVGDELFVDGVDRRTGEAVTDQRFVVERLYVSDTDAGSALVFAETPEEIPAAPQVILQTSVREDGPAAGPGRAWILDRETLLAKSDVVTEGGDLDDPCKYLLFFVLASAARG